MATVSPPTTVAAPLLPRRISSSAMTTPARPMNAKVLASIGLEVAPHGSRFSPHAAGTSDALVTTMANANTTSRTARPEAFAACDWLIPTLRAKQRSEVFAIAFSGSPPA